jgi:hypothetical protein
MGTYKDLGLLSCALAPYGWPFLPGWGAARCCILRSAHQVAHAASVVPERLQTTRRRGFEIPS